MVATDVHQHVWGAGFVDALRRRRDAPRLDGWTLHLDGEAPYDVDPADHDLSRRVDLAASDGFDLVLTSLSSPLGVEWLAPEGASALLDAYHDGAVARAAALRAPRTRPGRRRPVVGAGAGPVRAADARGVVRVPRVRAVPASGPAGVLRPARRPGPAARRASRRTRWRSRRARPRRLPRDLILRAARPRRDDSGARHRHDRVRL